MNLKKYNCNFSTEQIRPKTTSVQAKRGSRWLKDILTGVEKLVFNYLNQNVTKGTGQIYFSFGLMHQSDIFQLQNNWLMNL